MIRGWRRLLRLRFGRAERDVDDEVRFHIAERVADLEAFGETPEAARERALEEFGDVEAVRAELVEIDRGGQVEFKAKFSEEKIYCPGRKQVFRFSQDGKYHHDVIARFGETYADAEPLLQPLMRNGRRVEARRSASSVRETVLASVSRLPQPYHRLRDAPEYPVQKSGDLLQLLEQVRTQYVAASKPAGAPRSS